MKETLPGKILNRSWIESNVYNSWVLTLERWRSYALRCQASSSSLRILPRFDILHAW